MKKGIIISICLLTVSLFVSAQTVEDYTFTITELGGTPPSIKSIEKAAKKGDLAAQRELGLHYLNLGKTDSQNYKISYKWFIKAVIEHNDPIAYFYLATMHEKGISDAFIWDIAKWAKKDHSLYAIYNFWHRGMELVYRRNSDIAETFLRKVENSENAEALVLLGKKVQSWNPSNAIKYFKKAADKGNTEAQYYLGYCYFKGQGVDRNNEEARMWLNKALAQNYSKAQNLLNDIVEAERQDSIAQAQREEAERQRQAEAERQRQLALEHEREQQRQDSLAFAQGQKKAPYSYIVRNATTIDEPDDKFKYLCAGNMSAFFGKGNLDGLDMAAYKQSPQYKTDKEEFDRQRNKIYAVTKPLHACVQDFTFEADGIKIRPTFLGYSTFAGNYMDIGPFIGTRFLIPLTMNANKGVLYFKSSDLQALLKVKSSYNSHTAKLVILCKPSMLKDCIMPGSRELQTNASRRSFCVVDPIAMYIVDSASDEVLLDLSKYVKSISKPTVRQQFEAQIKNNNAAAERGSYKKTYHKTPRQTTCPYCLGKGYWVDWQGTPREERKRCTNCYGKGYVLEHNY